MSTLITATSISKAFGPQTLFTGIDVRIGEGDRLGLIGPNGAGKSTLLKILAGLEHADEGDVTRRKGLRLRYVPQDDRFAEGATPMSEVCRHLDEEHHHGADARTRANITLTKLGFTDTQRPVETLSGGWRKRLAIACALAHEPELLLFDEPTNHLDLEGVLWLEGFMRQAGQAIVFITHDRRFLENTATRIVEIARAYPDGAFEVKGNYTEFVRRKDAFLDAQAAEQSAVANKVRRDTAWLLQGIQGRQTRNKSQVKDAAMRREQLGELRARNASGAPVAGIDFQATGRQSVKLLTLEGVGKSMGGKRLFAGLDLALSPGKRVGLLGPNGSGKTTLLRICSGELEPDEGTVSRAENLRVVLFSQLRDSLNPEATLHEALCPVGDRVEFAGSTMHVTAWAARFLFDKEQLRNFVGNLSGGERARVCIAQLMLRPADALLLDEPTNDLDIPSLEALESTLLAFPGAIVLVTHDRFMLQRIATEYLALDGAGYASAHVSYEQWEKAQRSRVGAAEPARKSSQPAPAPAARPASPPKKLSYKFQRELDGMEAAILEAEGEAERLQAITEDPAIIADHVRAAKAYEALGAAQRNVETLYARWAELESMQQG
ncbi:MAG: ABC-F family ATP-binding cassette domain-containing protein [Phycisphaeraceae bacterium]|nr:ABC-F family ATP-binding cassette domain-containing protein [Phycisphaeraceae bacterium]